MKWLCNSIIIFFLLLNGENVYSQKSHLKKAELFFDAGKYAQALSSYHNYKKVNKSADLLIKRGICYLYTNQPDLCIEDMYQAEILKSINYKRFFYTAKAYFLKGEYEEAAKFYKRYLNVLKRSNAEYDLIIKEIERCGYARNLRYLPQIAFTENLGKPLNSEFNELKPKQSPNKAERYYFSSDKNDATGGLRNEKGITDIVKGKFAYDIYFSEFLEGNWTSVSTTNQMINTSQNEVIQGFNQEGTILYYLKKNFDGQTFLLADTFGTDKNILPKPINSLPFKAELGDQDLLMFNDSLMVFSSKRYSKSGDYDLFYAYEHNNLWSEPINFGPKVNSSFNERAPYLISNGNTLYFSSDRLDGLGGFDVFKSNFVNGFWTDHQNLGPSINSPANEMDIEFAADGTTAVFSSDRIQSFGGFDLYISYFKESVYGQLEITESLGFLDLFRAKEQSSVNTPVMTKENSIQPKQPIKTKEVISKPFYYNTDDDILSPGNMVQIRTLADILTIFPEVKVILQGHTTPEISPNADLYFSVKRAEKVFNQLLKMGVNKDMILIQGFGSHFPLAANTINGVSSTLANKVNKRIDIQWIISPETPLNVKYDTPTVLNEFRDNRWDMFQSKNSNVTFRIQIASTNQMLKSEWMSNYKDFIIEKDRLADKYIYTLGNFLMYQEAVDLMKQVESQFLISNLKVYLYLKSSRLNKTEIQTYSDTFPELMNYIKAQDGF